MKRQLSAAIAIAMLATGTAAVKAVGIESADAAKVVAGTYTIDPSHTAVAARIDHLGFSGTTVRFARSSGDYTYDPAHPDAARLRVSVDIASLSSDWAARDTELRGPKFFDVASFPVAQFTSETLKRIDASHATVSGQLTLHGVTRPVVMDVILRGSGKGMMGDTRTGFQAHFRIKRSDYGITTFLPAIGDDVEVAIDAEFSLGK